MLLQLENDTKICESSVLGDRRIKSNEKTEIVYTDAKN